MKYLACFIVTLVLFVACKNQRSGNPQVEIQTKFGDITIELYQKQAPKSVAAFLSNVDSGFYDNTYFYRVLNDGNQPSNAGKAELIQGGMYKNKYGRSKKLPSIPHESTHLTKLSHTDGTISLARQEPGTARSEFFIVTGDQPGLDSGGANNPDGQGYAAFGKVIKGMDVVYKIRGQNDYNQEFDPLIAIYKIERL